MDKVKTKKKWYKKWLVWVLIVLLGLFFISILSPPAPTGTGTTGTKTAQPEAGTAKTVYNLGEKVIIGDMEYMVGEEVFVLPVIGSDYVQTEADGTFIIFSVIIKNNGQSEVFLTSNSFKIKDAQSRKYNADTGASMYLSTMGFNGLVFKNLGAGLSTTGDIVFDVPNDDTGLILEITGEGLFTDTKSVEIGDVTDFSK